MVRQGQIRRRQHISGIDDSGLAQCDPFRPVTTGRFRGSWCAIGVSIGPSRPLHGFGLKGLGANIYFPGSTVSLDNATNSFIFSKL